MSNEPTKKVSINDQASIVISVPPEPVEKEPVSNENATASEEVAATKKCCAQCNKDVRCFFYCCIASWSCFLNSIECCCLGCSRCCLCCSDCALGCNRCLEQADCDGK